MPVSGIERRGRCYVGKGVRDYEELTLCANNRNRKERKMLPGCLMLMFENDVTVREGAWP